MQYTNSLINESSPYLLQHAHNPVNWMPWSDSVFDIAKKEDKLVLISIGYSACHWCHVMEHESFEDEQVAKVMNAHFINVKVDREERPDVDALYMSAVQLMSGHGGWPLNCFVLPDGRPVYGGTYFRKEQWLNVLDNLHNLFVTDKQKVLDFATSLTDGIKKSELIVIRSDSDLEINRSVLEKCVANWKKRFDQELGGPNKAPKFPLPNNYEFLLKYTHLSKDAEVRKHVELTLQKMACGGIYDQLGGGFARYSVDAYWKIPHFEKMLYDNAQLVSLYCHAYRLTKNKLYKEVVFETLGFVEKEWLNEEGGYYSALDADSEGVEGKYYVWQEDELRKLLKEEFALFSKYYNINDIGYWEHDNYVLIRTEKVAKILIEYNLKESELEERIIKCKEILLAERDKRIKPGLDDKILASWNGLMCKAFCEAYLTFGEKRFKESAVRCAQFIKNKLMRQDHSMWRSYKNGKARIHGFLDDSAFCIDAFMSVYTITQDETWLEIAKKMTDRTIDDFYNNESGLFYYTGKTGDNLIVRTTETSDNVIPASNSQMAHNLFKLSKIFMNEKYEGIVLKMLSHFTEEIMHYGAGYSNWASLYADLLAGVYEVCIVGKDVEEKLLAFGKHYEPNTIFVVTASASKLEILKQRFVEGDTVIYVCKNNTCLMPTGDVKEAVKQLETSI